MVKTYQAKRRLRIGETFREPGNLVPEAHTWRLIDSLLHSGHLREVEVDESAFRAAVAEACPELEADVLRAAGVAEAKPRTRKKS